MLIKIKDMIFLGIPRITLLSLFETLLPSLLMGFGLKYNRFRMKNSINQPFHRT